jgi:poly(beta-D-mannuronate) lyase
MAKPSWISVSPTSGQNNGSIQVTAAENTNIDNRSGVVEVTGGGITKSIDVS